jgi:hypothetical protein
MLPFIGFAHPFPEFVECGAFHPWFNRSPPLGWRHGEQKSHTARIVVSSMAVVARHFRRLEQTVASECIGQDHPDRFRAATACRPGP